MISVAVPTYNERQNIAELVKQTGEALLACGEDYELIIVDDSSPDGTAEEVGRLQEKRPWLRLMVRKNERDLSTAVLAGWRVARGDILACMDGDLQHPPKHLASLYDRLRKTDADIIIASRYVDQGGVSEWKLRRRVVSLIATLLARLLLSSSLGRVRDPMSGFFMLKRPVVEGITLSPRGYKILLEVLVQGRYCSCEEVPYTFEERSSGGSKMGLVQVWLFLVHLFRLSFQVKLRGFRKS